MQLFGRQSDHLVFRLFASDVLGDGRPHSRRDAAPRVEGDGDAAAAGDDGLALQHGLVGDRGCALAPAAAGLRAGASRRHHHDHFLVREETLPQKPDQSGGGGGLGRRRRRRRRHGIRGQREPLLQLQDKLMRSGGVGVPHLI